MLQCQLAHGSSTRTISGFGDIQHLYQTIADAFKVEFDDILYCTVNTHVPDMERALSGSVHPNDLLFAHLKGQEKQLSMLKMTDVIGVTIADNGCGKTFVKRLKKGSMAERAYPALAPGDHIAAVMGESMVGMRHYQVAEKLRSIPIGETIRFRLVAPLRIGFSYVGPRCARNKHSILAFGDEPIVIDLDQTNTMGRQFPGETLQFRVSDGRLMQDDSKEDREKVQLSPQRLRCPSSVIRKLNDIFDSYLGLNDDSLAITIWRLTRTCSNVSETANVLRNSEDISPFQFPDPVLCDIHNVITSSRSSASKLSK